MPIHVRADKNLGLAVVLFDGVVTTDEFERHLGPLLEDPEYSLMPLTLVDMTLAERAEGPSEVVERHAYRAAKNIDDKIEGEAKMALVATRDEFFGFGRMYSLLRHGSPVEFAMFRSLAEAEQWLGLPENYRAALQEVV